MEEKSTITILNDDGDEVVFDILVSFDSEETGKRYLIYTDYSKDENGNTRVYASACNPDDTQLEHLEDITTDKEWQTVEAVIQSIQENLAEKASN